MTINSSLEDVRRTALKADQVHIGYDGKEIVRGVTFRAEAGRFHTILGPNGSGKSTLLKALTGELSYTGEISLCDIDIATASETTLAGIRGVLPQQSTLSFPLTVAEVVNLGIRTDGGTFTRRERHDRICMALELVDLKGFGSRQFQTLSGGEQQRVQLARVLCQVWDPATRDGRPRWLFLDEPVSSLDIKHQMQIMEIAAGYAARGGGVIAIMHDLNLTAEFADTVLVLRQGEILAHGTVEEVYQTHILSAAYDFQVRVHQIPGHSKPVVLATAA